MKKTDFDQELINTLNSLKTEGNVNPSVFFKETTKVRLMNLISEEKVLEEKSSFVFRKNPKFAFRLAGIILIILIFVSSGTILAAQSSNPKNKLYPVKLASEEIALKFSPSSSLKANIAVEIVKRRGDEIASQQKTDNKPEIKRGIERYKESIDQAQSLVPSDNTHLNNELRNEESNLDELTRQYENSGQTEDQINPGQKVKGASDSKVNSPEQNLEQKSSEIEIKLPAEQQSNNRETIREETKTIEELTTTPSPEEHQ
jgi:hypothetical protein